VIFAMEEPETAIPPYAQKRIVHEVRTLASQTLFTSHSPYVLEEFGLEETIILGRDSSGVLTRHPAVLPDSVKPKRYRQEFRTRFSEGLLARRILVAEGATEVASYPAVCRRLAELDPAKYKSLEALGICTIDAGGQNNIPDLAKFYRDLGKRTFAICDNQTPKNVELIKAQVDTLFMHEEGGFEDLVLKNTKESALKRFAKVVDWPQHLKDKFGDVEAKAVDALREYFIWSKGNWGLADFLGQCTVDEIPDWLKSFCTSVVNVCEPNPAPEPPPEKPKGT
jgi:putative ATP-dependent endonuclease of the OLD family